MPAGNLAPRRTTYRDTLFRSITEARTAVFFEYAGIKYQYEPTTIKLVSGKLYVPDFYLSDFDVFVEVKPNNDVIRDVERNKADLLAVEGKDVWLTRGHPRYGYPWFEHIGQSQQCMIANDVTHSKSFWVLQADRQSCSKLSPGPHDKPCLWQDDIVMKLALKQADSFEPNEQEPASVGSVAQMVLEDTRRASSNT